MFNSRLDSTEDRIAELKDRPVEKNGVQSKKNGTNRTGYKKDRVMVKGPTDCNLRTRREWERSNL